MSVNYDGAYIQLDVVDNKYLYQFYMLNVASAP